MLAASPESFAAALAQLDLDLEQRISRLQRDRQRIKALLSGDRLLLPVEVVDYLDRLRTIGVSESTVAAERDGWTVLQALAPDELRAAITEKAAALDDPEFQSIYLAFDEASGWDADDPRLVRLAEEMVAFSQRHQPDSDLAAEVSPPADYSIAKELLTSLPNSDTPAWHRLTELSQGQVGHASTGSADVAVDQEPG